MKTYYVWSGSLKGAPIQAATPAAAVVNAVRTAVAQEDGCVLTNTIRVSLRPEGAHSLDVYFQAPYDQLLPDLFSDEDIESEILKVTKK